MTYEVMLHCLKCSCANEGEVCEECQIYGLIGNDHCENDAMQMAINIIEKLKAVYDFFSKSDLVVDKNIAQILELILMGKQE